MDFLITAWLWIYVILLTIAVTIPIGFLSVFLAPVDPQRRWAHRIGIFWGRAITKANPLWKMRVTGRQNIHPNQSYVVVSNHSSLADIICLYTLGMQFKWMAKTSLFKIPFLGWSMSFLKYIPLERGKHGSIRKSYEIARQWLRQGMSVLIFPEGTRSRDGNLGEFKNGAFKLAIESQKPILPIVLTGTQKAMAKGRMQVGIQSKASMTVLPPVETRELRPEDFEHLKNRVRSLIQKELENRMLPLSA